MSKLLRIAMEKVSAKCFFKSISEAKWGNIFRSKFKHSTRGKKVSSLFFIFLFFWKRYIQVRYVHYQQYHKRQNAVRNINHSEVSLEYPSVSFRPDLITVCNSFEIFRRGKEKISNERLKPVDYCALMTTTTF